MRLILKKKLALPKMPKTGTLKSLENFNKRLELVSKKNREIESYNKTLLAKAKAAQQRVAGINGSKKGK